MAMTLKLGTCIQYFKYSLCLHLWYPCISWSWTYAQIALLETNSACHEIKMFYMTHIRCLILMYTHNMFGEASLMNTDNIIILGRVKRICFFEHSVMTNFNCACPAIQRGQGSGFLSEGSSWLTARIGDKYQIRLTRSILCFYGKVIISNYHIFSCEIRLITLFHKLQLQFQEGFSEQNCLLNTCINCWKAVCINCWKAVKSFILIVHLLHVYYRNLCEVVVYSIILYSYCVLTLRYIV